MISKMQPGGEVRLDNTRVNRTYFPSIKLTLELLDNIRKTNLQKLVQKNLAVVYDTQKAKYYSNLLNFYNTNFFGYGIFGNPTNYNPTTSSGLLAILLNYDYAKENMTNFATNLGLGYVGFRFKPLMSKGYNGNLSTFEPFTIGEGAESLVIDNSPTTVAKISYIPVEEMELRNTIPGAAKAKYIGTVTAESGREYPVYVLRKLKVISKEKFDKNKDKIVLNLFKGKFKRGYLPLDNSEIYYNKTYVIDDIGEGNIGEDVFGNPKLIDFSINTFPDWAEYELGPIFGRYKVPNYVY